MPVTSIVLTALVGAWVLYLALWLKDGRAVSASRGDGISAFSRGLGSLADSISRNNHGSEPRGGLVGVLESPRTPAAASRRRRDVIIWLFCLALLSIAAVPLVGRVALFTHIAVDFILLVFLYAVARSQHLAAEREMKVRMLYPDRPQFDSSVVIPLRRTAGG